MLHLVWLCDLLLACTQLRSFCLTALQYTVYYFCLQKKNNACSRLVPPILTGSFFKHAQNLSLNTHHLPQGHMHASVLNPQTASITVFKLYCFINNEPWHVSEVKQLRTLLGRNMIIIVSCNIKLNLSVFCNINSIDTKVVDIRYQICKP